MLPPNWWIEHRENIFSPGEGQPERKGDQQSSDMPEVLPAGRTQLLAARGTVEPTGRVVGGHVKEPWMHHVALMVTGVVEEKSVKQGSEDNYRKGVSEFLGAQPL